MMLFGRFKEDLSEWEIATHDLIYKSPSSKVIVDMIYNEIRAKRLQFYWHSVRTMSHINYPGYRNGPIPHTGGWKHGGWRPNRGKHSHSMLAEYKYDCGMFRDMEEIECLPIIHMHLSRPRRAHDVKFWSEEYDGFHDYYGKGHGWKRSRKQKQWN